MRSVFICGLNPQPNDIKERLLTEGDTTLAKTIEMANIMEASKKSVEKMETETVFAGKASVSSQNNTEEVKIAKFRQHFNENTRKTSWQPKSQTKYSRVHRSLGCDKCGMVHQFVCPAKDKKCNFCEEIGHFSRRCPLKIRKQMNQAQVLFSESEGSDEEDNHMLVGNIKVKTTRMNGGKTRWNVNLYINEREFQCQIDTGADTNMISASDFMKLGYNKKDITHTGSKITGLGGFEVPVLGKANIIVAYKGKQHLLKLHIMEGDTHGILGLEAIIQLNLLERKDLSKDNLSNFYINNVIHNNLLAKYQDLFQGLGRLKGECHLNIKEDVRPTIDSPRRVPFNLLEPLKKELEKMVSLGVISAVDEPTEWVNSIVLVKKRNGSLRICLDPRNLNKAIKRSYQFPTIHNIKAKLAGAKIFSSLDASSGFWNVSLDNESSKLCTFITPFGRYRFLRLPFGISSAPEYFHFIMNKIFQGIDNVIIYIDDILIFGKTKKRA